MQFESISYFPMEDQIIRYADGLMAATKNSSELIPFRLRTNSDRGIAILDALAELYPDKNSSAIEGIGSALANEIGPYALSDGMVSHISRSGAELKNGGVIPFASPMEFLAPVIGSNNSELVTIQEIVNHLNESNQLILAWSIPEDSYTLAAKIVHAKRKECSWDEFLRVMDSIDGHRISEIILLVQNVSS